MRRSSSLVVVVLLAACAVKSSFTGGSTTSSSGTSTASTASGAPTETSGTSSAAPPSGDPNERIPMIDLMGKTPDEAIAAMRAAGFSGELEVNRSALECVDAKQVPGRINCQNPDVGKLHYRRSHVSVTVYQTPTHTGRLIREQLAKAVGMTIDDARKYMKSIGHTGELQVYEDPHTFYKNCAKDRVCSVQPEMGTGTGDRVTLMINRRTTDITMPD